ncbi:MAG: pitrilysin family protein [Rhodospirillales bacterium]|jgi:zinc protease|nr:pitrilysin family protein [Rhodospirillales bacterium]
MRRVVALASGYGLLGAALAAAIILGAALQPAAAVEVERVTTPGGIEAWLVRDHTNPIIAIRFAFRGGAALDPPTKGGLANMVSGLLDEGAGALDSQSFQRQLEDFAIRLSFDARRDSFGGRMTTLSENRDAAFALLGLALTAPRFDDEPVERIRGQIIARLKREAEDTDTLARKRLSQLLFPDHPYGRSVAGTPESVARITRAELAAFARARFARDNLVVGVVGDIRADELGALLESTFANLRATADGWTVPEAEPRASGETVVVRKPVPQSAVAFAQPGLKRTHPDFYAAYVMNYVLGGGGFTSRLYGEVREKRGLAYGVYSYLVTLKHAGLVSGGAGTANARVAETVDVIRSEWRRMAESGISEAELSDAKTYLTGSYPLRFSASGRIAAILVAIQLDDLGIDYLDKRDGLIEAVTLDDVNRVARELLAPRRLTTVIVGEPEGLSEGG